MRSKSIFPCPLETRSTLWQGPSVIKVVRELQEFLKTKMKRVKDGTFGTYWICTTCDRSKEFGCWAKTIYFCKNQGIDFNTFTEILNSFFGIGYDITCDADVMNKLPIRPEENPSKEDVPSDQTKKE